jgi:hypothetical protein
MLMFSAFNPAHKVCIEIVSKKPAATSPLCCFIVSIFILPKCIYKETKSVLINLNKPESTANAYWFSYISSDVHIFIIYLDSVIYDLARKPYVSIFYNTVIYGFLSIKKYLLITGV